MTPLQPVCNLIPAKLTSQEGTPPFDKDSFYRIASCGEFRRISTTLPQTTFPHVSLWKLFFCSLSSFCSLEPSKSRIQNKQDFNIFREASSFPFQRLKRPYYRPLFRKLFPETHTTKKIRSIKYWIFQELQTSFKNKAIRNLSSHQLLPTETEVLA